MLIARNRVKTLETQITELEAEASRLLRALDGMKEAKAEGENAERRRVEERAKEMATQVGTPTGRSITLMWQAAEIESLKVKVKQFSDYDEIKRELEIMKVRKSQH